MQYTYIMSDIHGHYTEFIEMLKKINFDKTDTLYIIGDIIDRGTENLKILDFIIENNNIHLLMGNHEDMLLHAYQDEGVNKLYYQTMWISNGGYTTEHELSMIDENKLNKYLSFLKKLPLYKFLNIDNHEYLLVHAGIDIQNKKYLNKEVLQKELINDSCLWIRDEFLNNKLIEQLPFTIIFGHTPTANIFYNTYDLPQDKKKLALDNKILKWSNRIAIDCGCAANRKLGCLRLDDMEEFYITCTEDL